MNLRLIFLKFFYKASVPNNELLIGIEVERSAVFETDLRPVQYSGTSGYLAILKKLVDNNQPAMAPNTAIPALGTAVKRCWRPPYVKRNHSRNCRAIQNPITENNIVIDETSISRFHAIITIDGNEVRLKDNGSKNHTFVDNKMIQSVVVITENSTIKFGDVEAKLLLKN